MKYKLEVNGVIDTENGSIIPNNEFNPDWIEYQAWLEAGNIPDPAFSADEIEVKRVDEIKETAGTKIVELMPEWKQRNSIARMAELMASVLDLSVLTTDEQAEITEALAQWEDISTIRATSDTAENDGTNPDDIDW